MRWTRRCARLEFWQTRSGIDIASRLAKWTRGGQFGFLFDNAEDTISFSRFQCFDFQRMSQYPELLEPLLFYILHRANAVISDREISPFSKPSSSMKHGCF
jgi:type IV secretory pathway VirB4 component